MKQIRVTLILFLLAAQTGIAQKTITLDDCFRLFKFYPESADKFQYMRDGKHYVDSDKKGLHIKDVRDEKRDSFIALQLPAAAQNFDQFDFSTDESKLLLRAETEPVYRHSVRANYFVYDFKSKSTTPVYEKGKQQFMTLSEDGAKAAFVFDNNLYYKDLNSGKVVQVTTDGLENSVINGLPDWVYEEEFSPVDGNGMVATRWSPDGKKLAFLRFDESQVPEIPLTWFEGDVYPRYSSFKYPKVGENNSIVSAHVYDLASGKLLQAETGAQTDQYLPRIHWTPDNSLAVTRMNRNQDTLDLLLFDPARATDNRMPGKLLLRETDPAYLEIESENKLVFLQNGQQFLWMSDKNGYQHIYLHQINAPELAPVQLTNGEYDITSFYGVDETNGTFYYQTATPTPMDRQIWEGSLYGKAPRLMTPKVGTNDASFCPSFDYYTYTWQDANTPPVITLCSRKGEVLDTFTLNTRFVKQRKEYGLSNKEFIKIPLQLASGKIELNGWMIKPPNFDERKKYPVLFDVYGGPGAQTVQNQYDGYLGAWHQMLAQKGYIIVSVDNRGTGARGAAFKKCTQLQLGKYETEDQIAAARYLGRMPYVDSTRIGIWGWSFGGYLSTSCILKGNDVFKMAMAVAPVTNWKWYDSAYTERYMHTTRDNAQGYEDNSPVNHASKLRGSNYLICHGTDDDNVHFQQTTEMINALIKANKQFEIGYYPGRNHGIYGDNATMHLFEKLTKFVMENL